MVGAVSQCVVDGLHRPVQSNPVQIQPISAQIESDPIQSNPIQSNPVSNEPDLEKYVQPESLAGANQYFCEKCDQKRDATKGLEFSSFPYLLTLQLKRFDFDYQYERRIKLNDRVTFPSSLVICVWDLFEEHHYVKK